ncbi:MAG: STAS domain-containing protein [Ruminococcus sp.]|jgi:anti-anti-sigma factor|nr:STAS domain-containing protein [Ruminococcus sp.]
MTVKPTQNGNKYTLTLQGRLDTTTAPELQAMLIPALDDAGISVVELDFAELEYISSAGLRVLLLGQKTAKKKDKSQIILNVRDEITEIFEMTGFSEFLSLG